MSRGIQLGVFALCTAAATLLAGWWSIPVLAALWVRLFPRAAAPVTTCGLGAACGWALLLAWGGLHGPVGTVAGRVGGAFRVSGWAFTGASLVFAALLAMAAASVAGKTRVR